MLALLLRSRFPLGPKHTSRHIMAEKAAAALQLLDDLYPPDEPWRGLGPAAAMKLTDEQRLEEEQSWVRVRAALEAFTQLDACERMAPFAAYNVGGAVRARVAQYAKNVAGQSFKTTTFVPTDVKYTLPLYLEPEDDSGSIVLRNPTGEPERRVVSYIKYLLRCAGILYHVVPDTSPVLLQLVLPLGPPPAPDAKPLPPQNESWVSNLLGLKRPPVVSRSSSVPPPTNRTIPAKPQETRGKRAWAQQAWLRIQVERSVGPSRAPSRSASQAGSRAPSRAPSQAGSRVQSRAPSQSSSRGPSRAPSRPPTRPASRNGHGEQHHPHHYQHHPDATALAHGLSAIAARPLSRRPDMKRSATQPSHSSPLARAVSQPTEKTPTGSAPPSPTSPSRPLSRHFAQLNTGTGPRVILSVTEPRGVALIRAALAVADPPPFERGSFFHTPPTPAVPIPDSESSRSSRSSVSEEERGRPRSKETPPDRNESSTPKPSGVMKERSKEKAREREKEREREERANNNNNKHKASRRHRHEGASALAPSIDHRRSSSVPPIGLSPE